MKKLLEKNSSEILENTKRKSNLIGSKKAAEMTIGTIVIIVLALIVLVVLIVGFTGGWGNLWGRISSYFGGNNVDAIVSACNVACSTNAQYDYCTRERTLKYGEKETATVTCKSLEQGTGTDSEKPIPGVTLEECKTVNCGGTAAKSCKGSVTACNTLMSESDCKGQGGCTWNAGVQPAKCDGVATACPGLDEGKCGTQDGCTWS